LRELVVGVAATSGLTGSFLVEILIAVKAETYSKWLEPRNKSPVFTIALLSLSSLVFNLACSYCSYLYMLDIYLCIIDILAWVV